jgi:hypothetical protein
MVGWQTSWCDLDCKRFDEFGSVLARAVAADWIVGTISRRRKAMEAPADSRYLQMCTEY